jgi:hypothetical protein
MYPEALSSQHLLKAIGTDAHGKGICDLIPLFLPVHHTSGEACLEGNAVGEVDSPGALDATNSITAPTSFECRNICARTIATSRLLLESHQKLVICHARS